MQMQGYIDEIKCSLTGDVLQLEIDDETIQRAVNSALREIQRYMSSTSFITVPYQECIDMKPYKVNSVTKVMRASAEGMGPVNGNGSSSQQAGFFDPLQASLWQIASPGGGLYNFNNFISRYAQWTTLQQIENTMSTDLAMYYDAPSEKLYINTVLNMGSNVTIQYVPRIESVEDVTSDYWVDVLMQMSKALCKIWLGRIRSRYKQSNALWEQDGETLLAEGREDLSKLREHLQKNTMLIYPYD